MAGLHSRQMLAYSFGNPETTGPKGLVFQCQSSSGIRVKEACLFYGRPLALMVHAVDHGKDFELQVIQSRKCVDDPDRLEAGQVVSALLRTDCGPPRSDRQYRAP